MIGPPVRPTDWIASASVDDASSSHDALVVDGSHRLVFNGIEISVVQGSGRVVGTGCVVSAGVETLVVHIASQYESLSGKQILELGSGVGAVGIATAAMGANVILTDVPTNPRPELRQSAEVVSSIGLFGNLLDVLQHNITMNSKAIAASGGSAKVLELYWDNEDQLQCIRDVAQGEPFDLILACNVTYDSNFYSALIGSLKTLAEHRTRIFIANTSVLGNMPVFLSLAEAAGFRSVSNTSDGETDIFELALA